MFDNERVILITQLCSEKRDHYRCITVPSELLKKHFPDTSGKHSASSHHYYNDKWHSPRGKNEIRAYLRGGIQFFYYDISGGGEYSRSYLPLTLHFSPRASRASATDCGMPTATSALFVRRLKSGNAWASGPRRRKRWRVIDRVVPEARGKGKTHPQRSRMVCRRAIGCRRSICSARSVKSPSGGWQLP
jgi:hypothetical protein